MINCVRYYDNALDKNKCDEIIKRFEYDTDRHMQTELEGHRYFTELNISAYPDWKDIHNMLVDEMQKFLKYYKHDLSLDDKVWPDELACEHFRMKRYLPNDKDEFKLHVDVGNHDSARRFLVYFWYLNDVEVGGETAFQWNSASETNSVIKPVAGRLLMFPPMWTYPHAGLKPISGPKYIIGGYLHYT